MADFKLSNEACEGIARNDYTLAYNDELNRLHVELEKPLDIDRTNNVRGQIQQLREHMKLRDKALDRLS